MANHLDNHVPTTSWNNDGRKAGASSLHPAPANGSAHVSKVPSQYVNWFAAPIQNNISETPTRLSRVRPDALSYWRTALNVPLRPFALTLPTMRLPAMVPAKSMSMDMNRTLVG